MIKPSIYVVPESENLWWGIYGFCEKASWEDLELYTENQEYIATVCLNSKSYLRYGIEKLEKDPVEKDFVDAIKRYLQDNKCHFWYYYADTELDELQEVSYWAPSNAKGIKPRFTDIWHPDEGIGLSTIETGVRAFAQRHLGLEDCQVIIENRGNFEQSLASFKKERDRMNSHSEEQVHFSDEVVNELCRLWSKPKEEVLAILTSSFQNK